MNTFTWTVIKGQDAIVTDFVRNPQNGDYDDISSANVVINATLVAAGHNVVIPATDIIKGTAGLLVNQFKIKLTRDITNVLLENMRYKLKLKIEYPDNSFPDSKRVVIYELDNFLDVRA